MLGRNRLGTTPLGRDTITTTAPGPVFDPALALVFEFVGTFPDGSVLEIDMEAKTVTLDGANVLWEASGDFWALLPGSTWVEYADTESSRSVALTVTHKDRWS